MQGYRAQGFRGLGLGFISYRVFPMNYLSTSQMLLSLVLLRAYRAGLAVYHNCMRPLGIRLAPLSPEGPKAILASTPDAEEPLPSGPQTAAFYKGWKTLSLGLHGPEKRGQQRNLYMSCSLGA